MYLQLELLDTPKGIYVSTRSVFQLLESEADDWAEMDALEVTTAFDSLISRLRAAVLSREDYEAKP